MLTVGMALAFISLIGLCGMTFAPALVSYFLFLLKKSKRKNFTSSNHSEVDILIPVHNQADALEATVKSILAIPGPHSIFVGLNACTDGTHRIAQDYGLKTITREIPGKWGMLKDLVDGATADWVVLLDSGTLVPEDFFAKLNLAQVSDHTIGIAPRYYPKKLSLIQKVIWIFESSLKKLENISGGPVSVHGACVIYKRSELKKAMDSLDEKNWLNDDVVIPLWMRFQNPGSKIIYRFDLCIDDFDVHLASPSSDRRKRLIKGNLDWIINLWPEILRNNLALFSLSTRRAFRLVWAWWITLSYLSLVFFIAHFSFIVALFVLSAPFFFSYNIAKYHQDLISAFTSSLFFFSDKKNIEWK